MKHIQNGYITGGIIMCIGIMKGGTLVGYIKSIRKDTGRYTMTTELRKAKHSYRTMWEVQSDIDTCTNYALSRGEILIVSNY